MNKADCYHLGHIAKLHGFKGEVSLFLDVTNPLEYENLDKIFVDINGFLTPFFIKSLTLRPKSQATLKIDGINSDKEAQQILKRSVYLPLVDLPQLSGKNFYDHEVVGFDLIDLTFGKVGVIQQIIDLPVNPLIQVDASGKEVLIPFVKDLIQEVKRNEKQLIVKAPEGLIAIYLG
ncbi:MAG: ribosome maturation factor RimM [Crocinitomicaceae bacterium]|jgi:16S rRNA processing protein RimM